MHGAHLAEIEEDVINPLLETKLLRNHFTAESEILTVIFGNLGFGVCGGGSVSEICESISELKGLLGQ